MPAKANICPRLRKLFLPLIRNISEIAINDNPEANNSEYHLNPLSSWKVE